MKNETRKIWVAPSLEAIEMFETASKALGGNEGECSNSNATRNTGQCS